MSLDDFDDLACAPPPDDSTKASASGTAGVSRRSFVRAATGLLATSGLGAVAAGQASKPNQQDAVELPQLHASTEAPEKSPAPSEAPAQRVGFAVVGLGHLTINQILPAFGTSKYCKVTALVSRDREKARKLAAQYGVPDSGLYDYTTYDKLADNPDVQVIYIVLPNSMHAEYVLRGAAARKHLSALPAAPSPPKADACHPGAPPGVSPPPPPPKPRRSCPHGWEAG